MPTDYWQGVGSGVTHEIALAVKSYIKINLKFLIYRPWCRAARAKYLIVPKKRLWASFPIEHFCGVLANSRLESRWSSP